MYTFTEHKMQQFAELIVRDCMDVVDGYTKQRIFDTHYDAVEQIEALFGIKHNGVKYTFKVGSRIKVISGFNVGAKGTVSYIEPTGRMWVLRDGAGSDVFYHPEEVIGVEE
jgi:transcription antitermination factor NusG